MKLDFQPDNNFYLQALQSFLDAVEGISREDEALNRMLSPDGNVSDGPYSELQYLLKVTLDISVIIQQNKLMPVILTSGSRSGTILVGHLIISHVGKCFRSWLSWSYTVFTNS